MMSICGPHRTRSRSDLLGGKAAAAQVEPDRLSRDRDVGLALDRFEQARGALADRPPEPVAQLVAVAARLVVAEPPVIGGHVTGTSLQEDALHARNRTLDGLA